MAWREGLGRSGEQIVRQLALLSFRASGYGVDSREFVCSFSSVEHEQFD